MAMKDGDFSYVDFWFQILITAGFPSNKNGLTVKHVENRLRISHPGGSGRDPFACKEQAGGETGIPCCFTIWL